MTFNGGDEVLQGLKSRVIEIKKGDGVSLFVKGFTTTSKSVVAPQVSHHLSVLPLHHKNNIQFTHLCF